MRRQLRGSREAGQARHFQEGLELIKVHKMRLTLLHRSGFKIVGNLSSCKAAEVTPQNNAALSRR